MAGESQDSKMLVFILIDMRGFIVITRSICMALLGDLKGNI